MVEKQQTNKQIKLYDLQKHMGWREMKRQK